MERQCREDKEFNQLTRQAQKVKDQLKREQIALHVVTIELLLAHELIILPTTRMDKVSKATKNRKRANVLRFGWFNERLRRQFQSRPSKIGFGIIWVGEEYTSCMCAKCGTFHGSLGPSKRFVCPDKNCGFSIDRDENGAWNIFFVGMAKVSSCKKERKGDADARSSKDQKKNTAKTSSSSGRGGAGVSEERHSKGENDTRCDSRQTRNQECGEGSDNRSHNRKHKRRKTSSSSGPGEEKPKEKRRKTSVSSVRGQEHDAERTKKIRKRKCEEGVDGQEIPSPKKTKRAEQNDTSVRLETAINHSAPHGRFVSQPHCYLGEICG